MNDNKNWLQFTVEKRPLCQDSSSITVFIKNKIRITSRLFLTLKQERGLYFFLNWGNRNILVLWFSGMVGKLYCEMKNVSYFPNHDVLIRTLRFHLFSKISKYYKTYGNKAITFLYKFGFSNTFMSRFYLFRKQKADVTFWQ